jgi:general nucleoside transport system permease protein
VNGLKNLFTALAAAFLGLLAGALLMLAIGANPIEGFSYLFRGGLMNVERIGNTLATATTLTLTGLAMAFAFRTGLFSIGASGQMLMGGLVSIALGLTLHLPKGLMLPIILACAMLAGAVYGFIPGYLKARFNVHEVVSTIMLNWIAYWTIYYTVPTYFKAEYLETESARIPEYASLKVPWLTHIFGGSFINLGVFVAIGCAILTALVLSKTTLGFELKAVGFNRHAAEFAGINVPKNMALSLAISGALAGLAGATYYVGYAVNMQIGVMPSQGMDGLAVALLGANSPVGVVLAALFFGVLHSGKGFMSAMTSIPPEIGDTIIAVIIYFAATSVLFTRIWNALSSRFRKKA